MQSALPVAVLARFTAISYCQAFCHLGSECAEPAWPSRMSNCVRFNIMSCNDRDIVYGIKGEIHSVDDFTHGEREREAGQGGVRMRCGATGVYTSLLHREEGHTLR